MRPPRAQAGVRSKFNVDLTPQGQVKRTCPHCGRRFDSVREKDHHLWLVAEQQAGRVKGHLCQTRVYLAWTDGELLVPFMGKKPTWYQPDFYVEMADGSVQIHEVKGHIDTGKPDTALWQLKLAIVALMHPEWTIQVIQ